MKDNVNIRDHLHISMKKGGALVDGVLAVGELHIVLRGPDGRIKDEEIVKNLVVKVGRNHIADQMADQGEAAMSHMAIGTGTTAPLDTDTALQSELDRNSLTSKTQGSGADAHKVTYVADWPAGDGTGAITEAGIFNSLSAGSMLNRAVFAVKNKDAADSMTLSWELSFAT